MLSVYKFTRLIHLTITRSIFALILILLIFSLVLKFGLGGFSIATNLVARTRLPSCELSQNDEEYQSTPPDGPDGKCKPASVIESGESLTELWTDSMISYEINTRRLVLLATQRMNQIVLEMTSKLGSNSTSCTSWWTNPLQVRNNTIIESTAFYDVHELEFVANTKWEAVTFRTTAIAYIYGDGDGKRGHVEFLKDNFQRMGTNSASLPCFRDENTPDAFLQLCSCDQGTSMQVVDDEKLISLPAWPANASFMISDYLHFHKPGGLFNVEPATPVCSSSSLLIMVISAPLNFPQRYIIRKTYGSKQELERHNASLLFLVGRVNDSNLEKVLDEEATIYNDIVQANFMDSYDNLTLKHLSMLAHVYFSCSKPSTTRRGDSLAFNRSTYNPPAFVLKADDDMFLNLDMALLLVAANQDVELMGSLNCNASVFREPDSKYYVPTYMYSAPVFPGFLLGGTILMRSDIIPQLLEASMTMPLLNLEDVYVTGLLSAAIGIKPKNSIVFGTHFEPKEVNRTMRYLQLRTMIHSHMDSVEEFQSTWDLWSSPPSVIEITTTFNESGYNISVADLKADRYSCSAF